MPLQRFLHGWTFIALSVNEILNHNDYDFCLFTIVSGSIIVSFGTTNDDADSRSHKKIIIIYVIVIITYFNNYLLSICSSLTVSRCGLFNTWMSQGR